MSSDRGGGPDLLSWKGGPRPWPSGRPWSEPTGLSLGPGSALPGPVSGGSCRAQAGPEFLVQGLNKPLRGRSSLAAQRGLRKLSKGGGGPGGEAPLCGAGDTRGLPGPDSLPGLAGRGGASAGLRRSRAVLGPSKPQGGEEKPAEARAQPRKSPLCSGPTRTRRPEIIR